MQTRIWLRLAEIAVPAILAITIFVSWQADRRDQAELASQLAAAQKTIAQATADQHDRDTALNQTLAQLAVQKQAAITPAQILKALPATLSLPAQITLQSSNSKSSSITDTPAAKQSVQGSLGQSTTLLNNPTPKPEQSTNAVLPAADLKPLYDFALDCKACQAKLTAAQSDLVDEKTKSATLAKERDAAIKAAKGGSALRRIVHAAKWFAIGAAAGAIAVKATH